MRSNVLCKILTFSIIILFVSVGIHPAIAIDPKIFYNENEEIVEPLGDIQPKDLFFQTLIEIANNPKIKNFLDNNIGKDILKEKYFDIDTDVYSKNMLSKKPLLFLSILSHKPKMTTEYLNFAYAKGTDAINLIGENEAVQLFNSINKSSISFLEDLQNIVINDEELNEKIEFLKILNEEERQESPFEFYPVLCGIVVISFILVVISWNVWLIPLELIYTIFPNEILYNIMWTISNIHETIFGLVILAGLLFCLEPGPPY